MEENIQGLEQMNRQNLELLSSFSPWSLVGGIIFGIVGLWLFRRGRRESLMRVVLVGVALMVYPLFTQDPIPTWLIGFALSGLGYYWLQEGHTV